MKENKGFPTDIYDIIEGVETDDIKNAFKVQISNNLGLTSRGAFEGGNIERFWVIDFKVQLLSKPSLVFR